MAQRKFTSDASYELRSPLMALRAELELVVGRPERVDGLLLAHLDGLGHRLGERIDDLVLLSTLDEGRPIDPTTVSLLALVHDEADGVTGAPNVSGDDTDVLVDRRLVARRAQHWWRMPNATLPARWRQ